MLISRDCKMATFPEKKRTGESRKIVQKFVETASSSGIDKWKPENIHCGRISRTSISVPPFRRSWTPLTRGRIRVSLPKFLRPSVSRPLPRGYLSSPIEGCSPPMPNFKNFLQNRANFTRLFFFFLFFNLLILNRWNSKKFLKKKKNQEKDKNAKEIPT